jgi:hypothetical protein
MPKQFFIPKLHVTVVEWRVRPKEFKMANAEEKAVCATSYVFTRYLVCASQTFCTYMYVPCLKLAPYNLERLRRLWSVLHKH